MKVIAGTSTIHAQTFAKALECEVVEDLGDPQSQGNYNLTPGEWVFWVGIDPGCKPHVERLRAAGKKVAAYWIGSDSMCAINDRTYRKNIPEFDAHIAVHERIQHELKDWGVAAEVVYPCARNYYKWYEIPPRTATTRTVGIYSPTPVDGDLYMHKECVQVAKENPDLKFIFYGAEKYQDLPDNAVDSGRMTPEDTKDLYSKFTCILRLCRHDGFAVGAIEAKIRNIHVVSNFPYVGFKYGESLEEINELLQQGETHEEDKGPWPSWFREAGSPEYFKRRIDQVLR